MTNYVGILYWLLYWAHVESLSDLYETFKIDMFQFCVKLKKTDSWLSSIARVSNIVFIWRGEGREQGPPASQPMLWNIANIATVIMHKSK